MLSEPVTKDELAPCEGVALLLQRMKSHPEEFDVEDGKWCHVLQGVYERVHRNSTNSVIPEPWMSRSEVEVIWREYVQLKQKRFHSWVMKTLLSPTEAEEKHYATKAMMQRMPRQSYPLQPGGVYETVAVQTSNTSIAQKLKDKINNL